MSLAIAGWIENRKQSTVSFLIRINGQIIGPLAYHEIIKRAVGWQKLGVSIEVAVAGTQMYQPLAAFLASGSTTWSACGSPNLSGAGQCGKCGIVFLTRRHKAESGYIKQCMVAVTVHLAARGCQDDHWPCRPHGDTLQRQTGPELEIILFQRRAARDSGSTAWACGVGNCSFCVGIRDLFGRFSFRETVSAAEGSFRRLWLICSATFSPDRLLRRNAEVPVRDIRVQDSLGQQWLVRIKGELICGNVKTGDEIVAECDDRQGTMILRSGWNKTINTAITLR